MTPAADSFGSYGRHGSPCLSLGAARVADRVVTLAIVLVLVLLMAISGYGLWDSWRVLEGGDQLAKPTDSNSFAELMAINPDVCAWITVDGTNIDYPVVQGKDDFEYLTKDARGEYAASGGIFLEAENDRSFPGPYEMLMGHHMAYGKMFGDLDKFLDLNFFGGNSTATLMLPDKTLSLEVMAVMQADADDGMVYGVSSAVSRMPELVSYINDHAIHKRGEGLSADDHVIALSTCNSAGADARTLLLCRVTGES